MLKDVHVSNILTKPTESWTVDDSRDVLLWSTPYFLQDNMLSFLSKADRGEIPRILSSEELLLSVPIYFYMSKIIPKSMVVVDCGAGIPIQQVFFQRHLKYIAVDKDVNILEMCPKVSTKVKYLGGDLKEILSSLTEGGARRNHFGVSVLCCSYFEDAKEVFRNSFDFYLSV